MVARVCFFCGGQRDKRTFSLKRTIPTIVFAAYLGKSLANGQLCFCFLVKFRLQKKTELRRYYNSELDGITNYLKPHFYLLKDKNTLFFPLQNNDKLSLVVGRKKTTSSLKRPQQLQQPPPPQNGTPASVASSASEDQIVADVGDSGLTTGHSSRPKKNGLSNGSTVDNKSTSFPAISHSR